MSIYLTASILNNMYSARHINGQLTNFIHKMIIIIYYFFSVLFINRIAQWTFMTWNLQNFRKVGIQRNIVWIVSNWKWTYVEEQCWISITHVYNVYCEVWTCYIFEITPLFPCFFVYFLHENYCNSHVKIHSLYERWWVNIVSLPSRDM